MHQKVKKYHHIEISTIKNLKILHAKVDVHLTTDLPPNYRPFMTDFGQTHPLLMDVICTWPLI